MYLTPGLLAEEKKKEDGEEVLRTLVTRSGGRLLGRVEDVGTETMVFGTAKDER